jgi:ankyrin repeat protein
VSGNFTPLHLASANGHEKMVQLLLNENAEIDPVTSNGSTPLHCAADFGHEATVHMLLHAKADVNISNDSGLTALHYAASRGHEKMVQLLLNENAEIDPVTSNGSTPLHCAADFRHEAIVRTLLHTKANVNVVNNSRWTALHYAASRGHVSTVELLLSHAFEVPTMTISSSTALHLAAQRHHVVDAPLEHVEWVNPLNRVIEEGYSNLSISIDFRNESGEPLLNAKSLAEMRDSWGWTALHFTAWQGHSEVVDNMVSVKDLDVDIQDNDGRTALSRASEKGHLAIVNRLLDTGASFKVTGQGGPLHLAASAGKVDVVECLLRAGAPVDSATKDGVTPLMMASFSGHTSVVKCLLGAKADAAIKDKKGLSAFHDAVSFGNMEIAELLLPDIFPLTSISVDIPVSLKDKLQLCISALRAYPTDQYLHRTLADLYFQAGDRQLALAAYDETLRLKPSEFRENEE